TTLVGTLIASFYLRLLKRFTLIKAVRFSFLTFFIGTILIWIGITAEFTRATFVLYLWAGLFGTLATVQAWSLITERMLSRQARRSFQFIGAGSIAGGLMGGLFARWTTGFISVGALLPVAALLTFLAFYLATVLAREVPVSVDQTAPQSNSIQ